MSQNHHAAWNDFWANSKSNGGNSGCLPSGYQRIDTAQQRCWGEFASKLPKAAKVLDLATGDGRVMHWLMSKRRDAKLTGCDMAEKLPPPPRGAKVHTGVLMEKLPFPEKRFHAVISQFGFEYGSTAETASEAARVLRDGGILAIMTHRQDGPILAHNLKRRQQIHWAIDEQELPEIAKKSLQLRSTGIFSIPDVISKAPAEGAQLHGPQSAAWEIAEALRQTLAMSRHDHPANVAQLIDTLVSRARNELGRIASLEAACATTADEERFTKAITAAGFEVTEKKAVSEEGSPQPFADFRTFRRG